MPKKNEKKGDYDVGYSKPPKSTQWQKGQSGNPSGKKKKEESIKAKLLKIAREEIVVHKDGSAVVMSNLDAMLYMAVTKAQSGNPQFFKLVIQELGLKAEEVPDWPQFEPTEADLAVLESQAGILALIDAARSKPGEPDGSKPDCEGDGDDVSDY